MKLNFFSKLLFSFLAISIIPLLFIGFISYGLLTHTLKDTISSQAYNSVIKINENIDILTSEYGELIVSLLAEDERIRGALLGKSTRDFEAIRQKLTIFAGKRNTAIYIVNPRGTVTFATHPLPRFYNPKLFTDQASARVIFRRADALKNGYIIYPHNYLNNTGDSVVYSIARAIRNERDLPIGYIIVEIFKSHIEEICNNINTNLNLDLIVVDPDFRTIANLHTPKLDGMFFRANFAKRITARKSGFFIDSEAGKQSLVAFHTSQYTRFITIGILPMRLILENSNYIKLITILTCIVSLIVCLVLAFFVAGSISRPINQLVGTMKRVEEGDLSTRVVFERGDELGRLGRSFNMMVGRIQELLDRGVEKQKQLRLYEIKALRAQINPHFLYNTLDSVKWLAKLNNVPEISAIVTRLGKLLRSSISYDDDQASVEESLQSIQYYLEIQKIRYNNKFEVVVDVASEIGCCRIPTLILQPIVENAISHGLEAREDHGWLRLCGRREQGDLIFEVNDNGVGMGPEKVKDINEGKDFQSSEHSIGIQNVARRIKLYYGEGYGLQVESELGRGTKVTLRMPLVIEKGELALRQEVSQ